ncbi:MAG: hypothetical protein J6P07_06160, partial [Spirochaetaceae bacterium]|nr:hypothetical protein [Spirochaetaceae bacterium]
LDREYLERGSNEGVSLLAKWLKSENASSEETKELAKVTRKEFAYEGGAWVEKYSSTEKKYVLKDWTEAGQHGTIITEDMFSNNPAKYSFLNEKVVVLSYNNQAFTFTRED